jgi:putative molybdopterin biosynthesis protein
MAVESEYLTTRELAELLRIKERKVYELANSGEIPCSRAMGKLLFPRAAVDAWLAESSSGFLPKTAAVERPAVFLGSHDPLLDWAIRESRCGLASYFDGSMDGLDRFADAEGVATGLHVYVPDGKAWNVPLVRQRFGNQRVALAEWAWRQRGLIVARDKSAEIASLADLRGRRVLPRQAEAGSQQTFEVLLAEQGIGTGELELLAPCRTETDAAVAILEDAADATFGLEGLAEQYGLPFVPIIRERFDLLVDRRAWFEPPMQRLFEFCRGGSFAAKAKAHRGYDVSGLGRIHFNGA